MALLHVLDLALLLGFALRLVRLVVADDVGEWLARGPARRAAERRGGWREKISDGLQCPFCVGFWLCVLALLSLVVAWDVGGPLLAVWRFVAGAFALNWVVGHVGARLGDAGYDDE